MSFTDDFLKCAPSGDPDKVTVSISVTMLVNPTIGVFADARGLVRKRKEQCSMPVEANAVTRHFFWLYSEI